MKTLSFVAALMLATAPATAATYFGATLTGAAENPPVMTDATGFGEIFVIGTSIQVEIDFMNLSSGLADGHIHCCVGPVGNTGVAIGFTGLPLGATSGTISRLIDLTDTASFRPNFITASGGTVDLARTRLLTAFESGEAYFNLHTVNFPGGEIRGNIAAIPEPASWVMMIAGFGLIGAAIRRRQSTAAA